MKKMRRSLVSLLLTLLLLTGMLAAQAAWDGTASTAFYSGTGTESSPYVIRTEKQLAYFMKQMAAGNDFAGKYIRLDADLNMTGGTWDAGTTDFAGIFLGNGHTVSLNSRFVYGIAEGGVIDWLDLRATQQVSRPLVCETNKGTIQNCRVEGEIYNSSSSSAMLCYDNKGTVVNSSGFGSIEGHGDGDSSCWVGWIARNTGIVKDCYTVVTLTGSASGKYNTLYKNGIVANSSGTIQNCYTNTEVLANDTEFVRLLNQSLSIPGYIWAEDTGNINGGYPIIKKCLSATVGLADIDAPMFTYHSSSLTTSISCDTSGCTIYYTLDGSNPVTSSTRKTYNSSLTVRGDVPITMVAYKNGEYGIPKSQYAVYLPGEGTEDDPYLISTKLQLCAVYLEPEAYYELTADLDFTNGGYVHNGVEMMGWTTIPSFSGTLDGNSHSITGLNSSKGGLINSNTGTIQDLRLIDHRLCLWASTRDRVESFGPLAHGSSGLITRCYVSGSTGAAVTNNSVGGIVGYNSGTISYCYSSGTLTTDGLDSYAWFEMGGIAGDNRGTVRSCYSDASLYGDRTSHDLGTTAGGIAYGGYVYDSRFDGTIEIDSYLASFGIGAAASHGDRASSYRCYDGGAALTSVGTNNRHYHTQETDLYKATGTGKDYMEKAFPAFDFDSVWMITDDGPMPQGIMQPDGKIYTKYSYTAPGMTTGGQTVCRVEGGDYETFTLPPAGRVMGTHGDNLYWERTAEGALIITGSGEMSGDDIFDFPWYVDPTTDQIVASQITSIEIGSGVTSIAPYAFYKSGATSITLPDTLTTIGNYAFDRSGITEMTLPASLKSIGYGVFYNKSVTLTFMGGAPQFENNTFDRAVVTAYYPANNTTWTSDVRQNYGGTVTWVCSGTCSHNSSYRTTVGKIEATCTTEGYTGDTVCRLCDTTVYTGSVTAFLGHKEVRQFLSEPTCTADGYITVTCSRCDYTKQDLMPALGHHLHTGKGDTLDPLVVENNSGVPFVQSGNTYTSANKAHNSSSEVRFHALYDCSIELIYNVSSQSYYDKMTILLNNTQKVESSGNYYSENGGAVLALDLKAGDVVTVRYSKNANTSSGRDLCKVELRYDRINLGIPAEEVEPTCASGVICDDCQAVVKEPLPHTTAIDEAAAPTCAETGLTAGSHCGVCGEVLVAQEIVPATGKHQYDLDEGVAPTCTTDGLTAGSSCHVCGLVHVAQEVIPATGHDETTLVAVAPTCTEMGLTEGLVCGTCGEILLEQDVVPELGHSDGPVVEENRVEPTCTEEGSYDEVIYCPVCCVETYRATQPIPYSGHGEEMTVEENQFDPTCTEAGSYDSVTLCTVCGEELIRETIEVPELGHTEVIDGAVESTCTSTGLTEGSHCDVCGEVLRAQTVTQEKNHTVVMDPPKAPTCTAPGLTGNGMHCAVCGTVLQAQTEIPALGHTPETDAAFAPTCVNTGLTAGSHCGVCGEVLVAQEIVPATGRHQYDFDEGFAPTCTTDGLTDGSSCHVCGFVHLAQTVIPATGHAAASVPGREETCSQTGLTEGIVCTVCGEVLLAQEEIPQLPHPDRVETEENVIPPTCTAEGFYDRVVRCTECHAELLRETVLVPEAGHTNGEAVVENETAPTCTMDGAYDKVTYCTVCGVESSRENVTVPKLGHTEVIDGAVESTCTSTGLTEGSHCGVCGEVLRAQTVTQEKNHTVVVDPPRAPTCTMPGYKGNGMHCAVCGTVLMAQTEIPALGHDFENGACVRCGEMDKSVVYDPETGMLVLNSLPEGTEAALVAVFAPNGQMIWLTTGEVGAVIFDLPMYSGCSIQVFYLDALYQPVCAAYMIHIE